MTITITNGKIITLDDANPYIANGYITISKGVIVDIGEGQPKEKLGEVIDAHGQYVLPGFINAHHHAYSSFARGSSFVGEKYCANFIEVLENIWWRLDRTLNLQDVKYSAYVAFIESIKNGVTTIVDHHASPNAARGSLFAMREAADHVGIRSCLCYEVTDRDGEKICQDGITENIDYINACKKNNNGFGTGIFGMHASFTLSDKSMEACLKANGGTGVGYHIHASEDIRDQYDSLKKHGKRVIERLNNFGILSPKSIVGHAIYSTNHELDMLKNSGATVAHNPESNMGNAVGIANVAHMVQRGVKVGLGTDGYTADILESIKTANVIQKHNSCDFNVGWPEIPNMLLKTNRELIESIMGIKAGIIQKGAVGDVIFVDYTPFTPLNGNNYIAHILFGLSGRTTSTVIIGGKVIMKDFKITAFDEEEIAAKSRELSQKVWDRI